MDLSAADLLQEPEKSKAFLLARNTDSPLTVSLMASSFSLCGASVVTVSSDYQYLMGKASHECIWVGIRFVEVLLVAAFSKLFEGEKFSFVFRI